MKSLFLLLVGLSMANVILAQQAEELVFSEKTFDFGTIKEEDGPIIHEFSFINNGIEPIKINNVKASCGCTTPAWTKEAVQPGKTGIIQAQYNPHNRPGTFNKSLTITIDGSDTPERLYIRGNVVPQVKSVEEELSTVMGGINVKYRSFNMGKVMTSDEPSIKEFDVYNASENKITFLDKVEAPDYIKINFEPQSLDPGKKGIIKVIYNGKAQKELGFSSDNVKFYTDEEGTDAVKSVAVYATVMEYFPPMSQEQLAKAPKMKIDEPVFDFGRLKPDEKATTTFKLTNTGQSELQIRQTKANCSCTVSKMKKETLKPGESAEMEVVFNAMGRRGNQQKSVTVYSNDPTASAQRVTIKAYVEEADN